jgi:hypothetical protein
MSMSSKLSHSQETWAEKLLLPPPNLFRKDDLTTIFRNAVRRGLYTREPVRLCRFRAHARRVYSGHGIGFSAPISAESVQNKQPLVAQPVVELLWRPSALFGAESPTSDQNKHALRA